MIIHYKYLQGKTFLSQFSRPISSRSRSFVTLKHMYSKCTHLTVPLHICILKHYMHLDKHVIKHHVIPKSKSVLSTTTSPSRGYAVRSVNRPAKNLTDPQAIKNQPPTPHYEVHRETCPTPTCKTQDCSTLCGPGKDLDVTGHFTSNPNPLLEPGKTAHNASATKLDNTPGSQTFVAYTDSHQTTPTATHTAGTNKLNTD